MLARDAVRWHLRNAACKGLNQMWNEGEAKLEAARTHAEVTTAAAPLLEVCRGCEALQLCRQWAQFDHYSGVAGGEVLYDGQPRQKAAPEHRRRQEAQVAS